MGTKGQRATSSSRPLILMEALIKFSSPDQQRCIPPLHSILIIIASQALGLTTFLDIVARLGLDLNELLSNTVTAVTIFVPTNKVRTKSHEGRTYVLMQNLMHVCYPSIVRE